MLLLSFRRLLLLTVKNLKKLQLVENYQGNDSSNLLELASQLQWADGHDSPTWATPTILFLEEGKEVFGHQGYMSPKEFYEALGGFQAG